MLRVPWTVRRRDKQQQLLARPLPSHVLQRHRAPAAARAVLDGRRAHGRLSSSGQACPIRARSAHRTPSLPAHARLACFPSRVPSRLTTRLPAQQLLRHEASLRTFLAVHIGTWGPRVTSRGHTWTKIEKIHDTSLRYSLVFKKLQQPLFRFATVAQNCDQEGHAMEPS